MNYKENGFKIFLRYIWKQKGLFLLDMICAVFVSAVDLIFPYLSRYSMNHLLPQGLFRTFFTVMALLLAAYVLRFFLYYIITVLGHRMGVYVEAEMRRDLFTHIQGMTFRFFDQNRTGVLMSRITSDLFEVTELAHHGPENVVICTLTILGSMILMGRINLSLTVVLAVLLAVGITVTIFLRHRMMTVNREVKKKTAEIYAAIESSISGIRTAKAFANDAQETKKFDRANDVFKGAKKEYYKCMGLFMSSMEFLTGIMQVAVITVGGFLIMQGKLNYVDLITFSLFVSTFSSPVRKLVQSAEQLTVGMAGFGRFLEIMRTEPDIQDAPDARELTNVTGQVDFENVSFSYSNEVPVLKGVDLHIEPGKCLAVVGASGGGKTTLCQLLPRFYEVTGGAVKVDGKDIRTLTQRSLRSRIGIIQQDVFLFAGTIRENILYGRPDASEEEMVEAAKLACIHEEIMKFPDGYDSYVGERGVMLSGGQKQRISIARAFLKNPPILILDEATSALDTVTEMQIQKSLDELSSGRTTIVIAHRLSTVRNADAIAVIEGGHVVELGNHEQLMEKDGTYAALYRAQSFGRLPDA